MYSPNFILRLFYTNPYNNKTFLKIFGENLLTIIVKMNYTSKSVKEILIYIFSKIDL